MTLTTFPAQKRSTASKGESFYKECIDAAIEMMTYEQSQGLRASFKEKRINYDLASNKLDQADVQSILNPFGLEGFDFPAEVRNYALLKPKIDVLVGEEMKRRFNWRVMLRNSDAVSEKEEMIKEKYFETMRRHIEAKQLDQNKLQQDLQKLDKWKNFEAQDMREKMGNEILTIQFDQQRLKTKFNRGFEDALIGGEEIYSFAILGGEPVAEKENPLGVHTLRCGDSPYIEDSDIIVIEGYKPVGKIIDEYHDELSNADIKKLEQQVTIAAKPERALTSLHVPENYMQEAYNEPIIIMPNTYFVNALGGAYDQFGNVRIRKVMWKSRRKIGVMSYFDPEDGSLVKDLVDENFKPDENSGQTIKWEWVTEWLQGVLIGEDIYVAMKPFPRIGVSMDNPSKCLAPIVGTIYNIGVNSAMSLMSYGKSYQYLYNLIMHQTERAVIKSRGVIPIIPLHMLPDGWTLEDYLYHISVTGIAVEDGAKEIQKGTATGKLAGTLGNGGGKYDLTNAAYIQQNAMMLQMIKAHIDDITGVSQQRQGQIENRELVGNVERSITQSSHITEKWFSLHDNTKVRVLEGLLELTKYAWRNNKFKRQFVLSDMSSIMLDFDGEEFASGQYGLFVSDAISDMELYNAMKSLAPEALRAKLIKFSDIMSIYMDNSTMSVRRKIEASEAAAEQAAQQASQQQAEQAQKELEFQHQMLQRQDETKRYIAELQANVKQMMNAGKNNGNNENANDLAERQMEMQDRHHMDEMADRERQRQVDATQAQQEMASKERIEKEKAKQKKVVSTAKK